MILVEHSFGVWDGVVLRWYEGLICLIYSISKNREEQDERT